MDRPLNSPFAPRRRAAAFPFAARQGGFTLVEMAVVLVIIGVILGAVMIGRDAQRNAEYLRIRQTFINQWAMAYNSYIQRAGVPPGDNVAAPSLRVKGAGAAAGAGPLAICEGATAPAGVGDATPASNLRATMREMGVQLPNGRGAGFEDRYVYLDTNGNPVQLQVCFQFNLPGTASGSGNVMVISGLVPDLARSLDVAIDGVVLANAGRFREVVAVGDPGAAWSVNNTADTAGGTADDDSGIAQVNAHYKMNQ